MKATTTPEPSGSLVQRIAQAVSILEEAVNTILKQEQTIETLERENNSLREAIARKS